MINLIKNELSKIFHKKAIYILGVVSILFLVLEVYMVKSMDLEVDTPLYYESLEQNLNDYNLNNLEEKEWYVSDKTELDIYNEAKKYPTDSWQYYAILQNNDDVTCMNESKYITKNNEQYEECKNKYNIFLSNIKKGDWKSYLQTQKNEYEKNLQNQKDLIIAYKNGSIPLEENTSLEKTVTTIEKEIKTIEYQIEGINYHLNKNIEPANTKQSHLIDNYVTSSIAYLEYNKEDDYAKKEELAEKRNLEKTIKEAKYKIDNNIPATEYPDGNIIISSEFSYIIFFVLISAIMISGTIVAEEYNKGTIKQLLIRPYTRKQILCSKYIASLITFILFFIFYYVLDCIAIGIASGFDTVSIPMIVYNFSTKNVMEISLVKYCIMNIIALLPEYIIILTVAFAASTIIGNSGVSIAVGFLTYILGDLVNTIALSVNVKILRFLPTMCWDFTPWLFGETPTYKYANFKTSVIVCIITYLLLITSSFFFFKRKNIKNQ